MPGSSRKRTAGELIHINVMAPPSVRARYVSGPRAVLVPWARQTSPATAGGRSVGGAGGRVGEAEEDRLGAVLGDGDRAVDAETVAGEAGPGPPAAAFEHAASESVSASARTARDRMTARPTGARSLPTSAVICRCCVGLG